MYRSSGPLNTFIQTIIDKFYIKDDYLSLIVHSDESFQIERLDILGFKPFGEYSISTHRAFILGATVKSTSMPVFDTTQVLSREPEVFHHVSVRSGVLCYTNMFNLSSPARLLTYTNPEYRDLIR